MIPSVIPKPKETIMYSMVRLMFDRKHVATKNKRDKVYVLKTCNGTEIKTLTSSQKKDYVPFISINPNPNIRTFRGCAE